MTSAPAAKLDAPAPARMIRLRGVEVHNLRAVDLDLPHRRLIVFCGVSGSGKTSLAFDTLYAEGQRRYIESFSAHTRQFLETLEKPAAERIEGLPPAIAVAQRTAPRSHRATVGTITEAHDYLRLLFARIGRVVCPECGREVRRDSPQAVAEMLAALPGGAKFMIAFPRAAAAAEWPALLASLREEGFVRAVCGDGVASIDAANAERFAAAERCDVVVDRLAAGATSEKRIRDSVETAFAHGGGRCCAWVEAGDAASALGGTTRRLDGEAWRRLAWSERLSCDDCGREFAAPEPRLFSFNSPLGACPACEGHGDILAVEMRLVVPDTSKSLREGAIAPWTTPAYKHELDELLALAADYGLPVDVPFAELTAEHLRVIHEGAPERKFGGLNGFFAWLERRKYKTPIRSFLARWRTARVCDACHGARLRPEALCVRVGGRNLAEVAALRISAAAEFLRAAPVALHERFIGRLVLDQALARLAFVEAVGLGYLTLDRAARTLSAGEAQRVALASALGSSLVNMLYVLDEPSVGLHPRDTDRLLTAIEGLRDRGNSVVVVEHDEAFLRAADMIVEIGPGAGQHGGEIVYQGPPQEMTACATSLTGDYLAGRRAIRPSSARREPKHGRIRLVGARGNNLRNLTVEFPLGLLCVVSGVSGAGKSTLVQETLYPALCRRLRKEAPSAAPYDDVYGDGQLNDVILVDQSPIGRTPRSNPVTYIKAFDEIRRVFASTLDARTRNYTASSFSFNVEGGRCPACSGDGFIAIDMRFLADVYKRCAECRGRRYRPEILAVKYRGHDIAEVLDMTVREAFAFFRGHKKAQAALKRLIDVGLDYLRLGQPANTLSGGEAQRLKLATHLSATSRGRCLFLLDEPTTGLHFADVARLLETFEALLAVGHSLIVVEHNLALLRAADYLIDLGPGAADEGGQIVAQGSPEEVARCERSLTGRYLAEAPARFAHEQDEERHA